MLVLPLVFFHYGVIYPGRSDRIRLSLSPISALLYLLRSTYGVLRMDTGIQYKVSLN